MALRSHNYGENHEGLVGNLYGNLGAGGQREDTLKASIWARYPAGETRGQATRENYRIWHMEYRY